MKDPLHVAHVVLSLDVGGLERIVLDLVRKGPEFGQKVSVICLERPGTLARQVEELGAQIICLDKPPGRRPETVGRARDALIRLRPDVVHSHQIGALYYTGPAAESTGIPLIVHTEHINQVTKYPALQDRLRIRLLWWMAGRRAARFFCVSKDIADEVTSYGILPRNRVCVMPNGIDTAQFRGREGAIALREDLGIAQDATVVGTVGRINEVKCQDRLIRAFRLVCERFPKARLLLVGDGPKMSDLRKLTEELKLEKFVHFAGYQPKPEKFMQIMDVFALTSRSEGMPLAILEAWAAGLPVVATRVGGIPQMIEHGRTGMLVDPGDEAALTAALQDLIAEPAMARSLGSAARQLAESRFDTRQMAGNYDRHYRELLVTKGASSRCAS